MSITILHGEHHVNSRSKLVELIDEAKQKGMETTHVEVSGLTSAILESELGSQDMFISEKVIVIEGLATSTRSKKKDEMLDLVIKYSESSHIILWEGKKLTPAQQKKFTHAKEHLYNLSSSLFEWLDSLHSQIPRKLELLQQAVQQDGIEFCFAMLTRQIRLLLLTKSGAAMKEHPFVIKKLQQQAKAFTLPQLISIHEQLTLLDFHQKTGQLKLSMTEKLEEMMINMNGR